MTAKIKFILEPEDMKTKSKKEILDTIHQTQIAQKGKPNGFTTTKWVLEKSTLRKSSQLVALQIANKISKDKGYAFPSVRFLQTRTGLSRATIINAIREIEESGEWYVQRGGFSNSTKDNTIQRRRVNRYFPLAESLYQPDKKNRTKD